MRCDNDNERRFCLVGFSSGMNLSEEIEAADSGKINIEQQQVKSSFAHQRASSFGTLGFDDFTGDTLERAPDAIARGFLIIDNQQTQAVLFHGNSSGF